jgi:quercetin dioxygenase-like cupin family protein
LSSNNQPYNWDGVPKEQINDRLLRQAIHADAMTVARLEMTPGCLVASHSHHNEQISMAEAGRVKFTVDGKEIILKAGDVLHIRPHQVHSAEALDNSVLVELFSPRRDDWIKQ